MNIEREFEICEKREKKEGKKNRNTVETVRGVSECVCDCLRQNCKCDRPARNAKNVSKKDKHYCFLIFQK
jgi:hypothetical protein